MTTKPDDRLPLPAFVAGPWSLTARLTWLYAGSTAVVLLLAAGYLYWGLAQGLHRNDRALVEGKLRVLRVLLHEHADKPDALASEIEHEAEANEFLKYYLRVLDTRGRVVIETPGMGGLLPVTEFPELVRLPDGTEPVVQRTMPSGKTYLLIVADSAAADALSGQRWRLHVALDIAHREALLAHYRLTLVVALAAGIVLAALAGIFVARAGLRPLRAITHATRRITASRLDERVVPAQWPVELRELATAFDAMLDRLQNSFNRLTEFSADIAHAMRNPINNLRGETEVALTRARTPDEYRQSLASALEEFDRLSRMIEGLLFIARADDPRAALTPVPLAVRVELEAVREFYDALAADRRVTVLCEGEAEFTADPMLVRRAVSNLLGNALKHTPPGGTVRLAARTLPDGAAEISVADTGVGIAPEHLPKVFERFFQVDKTQADPAKGAGLGLAIVQSIMRLHGGTAHVASVVGAGTTITLTFPVRMEASGPSKT